MTDRKMVLIFGMILVVTLALSVLSSYVGWYVYHR